MRFRTASLQQMLAISATDIFVHIRLISGIVFAIFGFMLLWGGIAAAQDRFMRHRQFVKLTTHFEGGGGAFQSTEGGAWVWALPPAQIDANTGHLAGPLITVSRLMGIPFARLRASIPPELIRGSMADAIGRPGPVSAEALSADTRWEERRIQRMLSSGPGGGGGASSADGGSLSTRRQMRRSISAGAAPKRSSIARTSTATARMVAPQQPRSPTAAGWASTGPPEALAALPSSAGSAADDGGSPTAAAARSSPPGAALATHSGSSNGALLSRAKSTGSRYGPAPEAMRRVVSRTPSPSRLSVTAVAATDGPSGAAQSAGGAAASIGEQTAGAASGAGGLPTAPSLGRSRTSSLARLEGNRIEGDAPSSAAGEQDGHQLSPLGPGRARPPRSVEWLTPAAPDASKVASTGPPVDAAAASNLRRRKTATGAVITSSTTAGEVKSIDYSPTSPHATRRVTSTQSGMLPRLRRASSATGNAASSNDAGAAAALLPRQPLPQSLLARLRRRASTTATGTATQATSGGGVSRTASLPRSALRPRAESAGDSPGGSPAVTSDAVVVTLQPPAPARRASATNYSRRRSISPQRGGDHLLGELHAAPHGAREVVGRSSAAHSLHRRLSAPLSRRNANGLPADNNTDISAEEVLVGTALVFAYMFVGRLLPFAQIAERQRRTAEYFARHGAAAPKGLSFDELVGRFKTLLAHGAPVPQWCVNRQSRGERVVCVLPHQNIFTLRSMHAPVGLPPECVSA